MPRDSRPFIAVNDKIVALRLAGDCLVDGGDQMCRVVAGAQDFVQIGGSVLAQTHVECAVACKADLIAALAELWGIGVMKPI